MRLTIIAICCLLVVAGATVFAQSDRGTVTGSVTDQAGAVIPNAAIEIKNINTSAVYQTQSSSTGNYTFSLLPAGKYQMSSSVPGFKQFVRTGITVMVAQILRIDISLEVGNISETVTVSGDLTMSNVTVNPGALPATTTAMNVSGNVNLVGIVGLTNTTITTGTGKRDGRQESWLDPNS